jgi:hypothetical protein
MSSAHDCDNYLDAFTETLPKRGFTKLNSSDIVECIHVATRVVNFRMLSQS